MLMKFGIIIRTTFHSQFTNDCAIAANHTILVIYKLNTFILVNLKYANDSIVLRIDDLKTVMKH